MDTDFTPNMTLADAKDLLFKKAWEHALKCPTCTRDVAFRPRRITIGMKVALSLIASTSGPTNRWVHALDVISPMQTQFHGIVDYSKLKYWDLIESLDAMDHAARDAERSKGHAGTGLWRMTRTGWLFLTNRIKLPAAMLIFDDKIMQRSEELKTWAETESRGFDWNEIHLPSFTPPDDLDDDDEQLALGL